MDGHVKAVVISLVFNGITFDNTYRFDNDEEYYCESGNGSPEYSISDLDDENRSGDGHGNGLLETYFGKRCGLKMGNGHSKERGCD